MKNTKKILLLGLAFVLVIALSIAGTLAFLTASTETVTNTFTVGTLFDPDDTTAGLTLNESKAVAKEGDLGAYELDTTDKVMGNTYVVYPGVDIPKDPTVTVTGLKTGVEAYLFIEVLDNTGDDVTATITDDWTETTLTPKTDGAKVYLYKNAKISAAVTSKILVDDKLVVRSDVDQVSKPDSGAFGLSFNAYLLQAAGFASAADAWTAINTPAANP